MPGKKCCYTFIRLTKPSSHQFTWLTLCSDELYQAMSALDEKTKAERALKDLQMVQGEQQVLFHIVT